VLFRKLILLKVRGAFFDAPPTSSSMDSQFLNDRLQADVAKGLKPSKVKVKSEHHRELYPNPIHRIDMRENHNLTFSFIDDT
jgi:hypothetical protein